MERIAVISIERESLEPIVPTLRDGAGNILLPADVDLIEFAITDYSTPRAEVPEEAWEASVPYQGRAAIWVGPTTAHDWTDVVTFPHLWRLYARLTAGPIKPVLSGGVGRTI
jgi:hypothetical protein